MEWQPPNLRTVGICRVSPDGLDFVVKHTSATAQALLTQHPVAMLHSKGNFLPGHSAEQWRFEGSHCIDLEWTVDEILQRVPRFTIISILGSHRLVKKQHKQQQEQLLKQERSTTTAQDNDDPAPVSPNRIALANSKSRLVELMQTARMELENGGICGDELKECIRPLRLFPDRVECMLASPDASIMWDRWEWLRRPRNDEHSDDNDDRNNANQMEWFNPQQLVPH